MIGATSLPRFDKFKSLLMLLGVCGVLFFYGLTERDLWSSHEARAAQDASSILEEGHWGLPHLFDRHAELQKPPLYYWLVAGIGKFRGGVDAWAVRLPAAMSALIAVLVVYFLGCSRQRPKAGILGALMLATSLHFTWLARVGRIDMPLTLTTTAALAAFYQGRKAQLSGGPRMGFSYLLLPYLAAGLSVLFKGPIGFLLPAIVAVVFLIAEASMARSRRRDCPAPTTPSPHLGIWWGLPLVAVIALPWFVWANSETEGQLWNVFFVKHNLERGLGGGKLASHPWWFYGPQLFLDALPWSLLLPGALWLFWRRGWWRIDPEARFGLVWLLSVIVLLSLSKFKRADYLLPAYPGLALFLGCVADRWSANLSRPRITKIAFAGVVASCVIGWTGYVSYGIAGEDSRLEWRSFAREIRRRAPAPQLVLFFRAEAHALAFHVGRPVDTILEWENLDVWAGRPETYYVVMPPDCAGEWPKYLHKGLLEEVLQSSVLVEGEQPRPLVLLRTRPREARSPD
jgi:4-amino-4-deoxy-L-arabinose transferase-like glycosyltransferase